MEPAVATPSGFFSPVTVGDVHNLEFMFPETTEIGVAVKAAGSHFSRLEEPLPFRRGPFQVLNDLAKWEAQEQLPADKEGLASARRKRMILGQSLRSFNTLTIPRRSQQGPEVM